LLWDERIEPVNPIPEGLRNTSSKDKILDDILALKQRAIVREERLNQLSTQFQTAQNEYDRIGNRHLSTLAQTGKNNRASFVTRRQAL
jgi:hypothetical protein